MGLNTHTPDSTRKRQLAEIGRRAAVAIGIALCVWAILAALRGCEPKPVGTWRDDEARRAAAEFLRTGVTLHVQEPAGIERRAEPVTSGVPLPRGCVTDRSRLILLDSQGNAVPCQFTPLCRWPDGDGKTEERKDGSIKWVLLDFQADLPAAASACLQSPGDRQAAQAVVAASNTANHRLCVADGPTEAPEPSEPVRVEDKADCVELRTGALIVRVSKSRGTVIESAELGGKRIVGADKPADAVLRLEDGNVYRTSACKPDLVQIEDSGPMRACVRVKGKFADTTGTALLKGKISYDLRVTAYAGKPWLKLAFTFENRGDFAKAHDRLYFKNLRLDVPVASEAVSDDGWEMECPVGAIGIATNKTAGFTQWLEYPALNEIGWQYGEKANNYACPEDEAIRQKIAGVSESENVFYWLATDGDKVWGWEGRMPGWAVFKKQGTPLIGVCMRSFWQNFPRGFEAEAGTISALLWPEGGFWPRTGKMSKRVAYQFEGSRAKTTELLLYFGAPERGEAMAGRFESPLAASASVEWYERTDAVWPLAPAGVRAMDPDLVEALTRYDRLQRAKLHVEEADAAGVVKLEEGVWTEDKWGRISIPSAMDRMPDVFYGFMNYGDLIWGFGYCSLFYDWPYGMLLQYLRFGDRQMFDLAEAMTRHRYDIDRFGAWQQYEKGYHGDRDRIDDEKYGKRGYYNPNPSHTWCRGLFLHWALTGDRRSLETAEENALAYFHWLDRHKERVVDYREFRTPGWAIEACLAMYEYRGDREYLEKAREIFERTLLGMERKNGKRGHLIPGGKQSTQFVSYIIEPVARLHRLTADSEVAGFLRRLLDWHRKEGVIFGDEKDGKYRPLKFAIKWDRARTRPDMVFTVTLAYGLQFADGYAYLHRVYGREEDLEFGRKVFRDFMFYYGIPDLEVERGARCLLGYHFAGEMQVWAAKLHAFTSRYGLEAMAMEQRADEIGGRR